MDICIIPSAVELSVWTGVAGCGCPISSRIILSSTPFRALMYNDRSSDSAAEDMTALMISATLWMAPYCLGGRVHFRIDNGGPPARLRAFSY
jgi:hypothetical protein